MSSYNLWRVSQISLTVFFSVTLEKTKFVIVKCKLAMTLSFISFHLSSVTFAGFPSIASYLYFSKREFAPIELLYLIFCCHGFTLKNWLTQFPLRIVLLTRTMNTRTMNVDCELSHQISSQEREAGHQQTHLNTKSFLS